MATLETRTLGRSKARAAALLLVAASLAACGGGKAPPDVRRAWAPEELAPPQAEKSWQPSEPEAALQPSANAWQDDLLRAARRRADLRPAGAIDVACATTSTPAPPESARAAASAYGCRWRRTTRRCARRRR
jgi:hypothetical protein